MSDRTGESWAGQRAGLPAPPSPVPHGGGGPLRRGRWIGPLVALVAAFLLVAALLDLGTGTTPSTTTRSAPSTATGAHASAVKAVVDINTAQQSFGTDGLHPLGAASGIVLTAGGEILTNNHVVEGATRVRVTIVGQGTATATVLGVDPTDDVALLQLNGVSGLTPAKMGDSSTVQVGDAVTAIGNAFGRGGAPTVATGSVTAVHKSITASDPGGGSSEHLSDVIQTDAAIHPGDSGGALVNANGEVVGIITAGPRDAGSGGGFAIPIDAALSIVHQIEAGNGSSTILIGERGFLGVAAQALDPSVAAQLGLSDTSGVQVTGVFPDTPADRAGMTAPAVIRTIDTQTIDSLDALSAALHAKTPGERVRITWVDQAGEHTATVALIAGPAV
jgi:S1-C subfamily serine protease